jgi:hypothetical protein
MSGGEKLAQLMNALNGPGAEHFAALMNQLDAGGGEKLGQILAAMSTDEIEAFGRALSKDPHPNVPKFFSSWINRESPAEFLKGFRKMHALSGTKKAGCAGVLAAVVAIGTGALWHWFG